MLRPSNVAFRNLTRSSIDLLWKHYVIGLDYAEIAEERQLSYDSARMKIGRCLEEARSLV